MNWHRVFAMVFRHTTGLKHSLDRFTDMFYWPAMDLLIWGLTGLYLAQFNSNSAHYYFAVVLSGLVFWIVIWRSQYEVSTNILAELWDRNLINIFASPLTIWEWIASFMIFGFLKTIVSVTFSALLAFLLYHFNVFVLGWYLIPIFISLIITGWTCGFFVGGILIRFGNKVQTLAWAGVALMAPFSAIYYPVSVLPHWAQKIAWGIPSTYIFEGVRQLLFTKHLSQELLIFSFVLNVLYFPLALIFFVYMFKKSVRLGLSRLI